MQELNKLDPDHKNNPDIQLREITLRLREQRFDLQKSKLSLDDKETELVRFVKQSQEQQDEIAAQGSQIQYLKKQLTVEQNRMDEMQKFSKYVNELQNCKILIGDYKRQIKTLNDRNQSIINSYENQIEQIHQQYRENQKCTPEYVMQLQETIRRNTKYIYDLEAENAKLIGKQLEFQNEIQDYRAQTSRAQVELKLANERYAYMLQQQQDFKSEILSLRQEISLKELMLTEKTAKAEILEKTQLPKEHFLYDKAANAQKPNPKYLIKPQQIQAVIDRYENELAETRARNVRLFANMVHRNATVFEKLVQRLTAIEETLDQ